jgi:hypothetical protein
MTPSVPKNYIHILWHVDQLLGNDRKTNYYTTARKQQKRNGVFCAIHDETL